MANLGVDDFKSKLLGGGARNNLFQVTTNFPSFVGGDVELASFMCKGASLPAATIAPIPVKFRGRELKLAGDRTFADWSITIMADGKHSVRSAFEIWMNGINAHDENTGLSNPNDYMSDMTIDQLNKQGEVVKSYIMRGCWPSELGAIDMSYESDGTISEFTVTITYQYWTSDTTS
jgi:hypothetical protein